MREASVQRPAHDGLLCQAGRNWRREVRGMEGRQELFAEGRQGGRGCAKGMRGETERTSRKCKCVWGGGRKRVNKVQRERRQLRDRERHEGRRRQQSEFIFINGERAERELLKKRKMNERMSEDGGEG